MPKRPTAATAKPSLASSEDPSPALADTPDREVMIAFPVPEALHTALKVRAAQERTTVRGMVMKALRMLGLDVPDADLADRRIGRAGRPPRER